MRRQRRRRTALKCALPQRGSREIAAIETGSRAIGNSEAGLLERDDKPGIIEKDRIRPDRREGGQSVRIDMTHREGRVCVRQGPRAGLADHDGKMEAGHPHRFGALPGRLALP